MKNKIVALLIGLLLLPVAASGATTTAPRFLAAPAPVWNSLDYAPAPADNPLKGFMPFTDAYSSRTQPLANAFPHSMEWFYVPLKNLMNGPHSFTFDTGLEPTLNDIASRGHQAVFRVYLDYPHRPSGIPRFLLDGGLTVRPYAFFGNLPGESVSPDYEDPQLLAALEAFIAAFGQRYDGDPRIGFITAGLVGFWGEWHTWPLDGYTEDGSPEENWMPSDATQMRLLKDYDNAFGETKLLVRYPTGRANSLSATPGHRIPYASAKLNIGYHDDSFAFETLFGYDWDFMSKLQWSGAIDTWQKEAIGGELRPEIQIGIWLDPPRPDAEDFTTAVDTTHASWLIAHAIFTTRSLSGPVYDRALAGAQRLGYEFYVSALKLGDMRQSDPLRASLRIQNTGVAPFYYDWPLQLAALDSSGHLAATWDTSWKLSDLPLPGDRQHPYSDLQFEQPDTGLAPGAYKLLLRVANPLANGKALRFANATQDQDLGGWLTLGPFTVTP